MPKHQIFVDTNVCNHVAYQNLDHQWRSIGTYVLSNYKYVISPITLIELLGKIGRGDARYFEKNRKALRVLLGTRTKRTFLRFPGQFVLRHTLGYNAPTKLGPRDFENWTRIALKAPDKASLQNGEVQLYNAPHKTFGFDFQLHETQRDQGKTQHIRILEEVRGGRKRPSTPLRWAAGILVRYGINPSEEACMKVARALDAAYCFDKYLWRLAKNPSYNFKEHDTDWEDRQQLFYLCNEHIWFVTADTDILRETKISAQSARIISFNTLLELAEARRKLA